MMMLMVSPIEVMTRRFRRHHSLKVPPQRELEPARELELAPPGGASEKGSAVDGATAERGFRSDTSVQQPLAPGQAIQKFCVITEADLVPKSLYDET